RDLLTEAVHDPVVVVVAVLVTVLVLAERAGVAGLFAGARRDRRGRRPLRHAHHLVQGGDLAAGPVEGVVAVREFAGGAGLEVVARVHRLGRRLRRALHAGPLELGRERIVGGGLIRQRRAAASASEE